MFNISRILLRSSLVAKEIFILLPEIETFVPSFSFIASSTYLYSFDFSLFLIGVILENEDKEVILSKSLTLKFSFTILLDNCSISSLFSYLLRILA